jgi:hypothetical protein
MQEFVSTGHLGDIMIGITADRAQQVLGAPDARSARHDPVEILRYGALELVFRRVPKTTDSRLVAIALYLGDQDRLIPEPARFADWLPAADTTEQQFREFLAGVGIAPRSTAAGESSHLVLPSGAQIVFADGKLHSIHFKRNVSDRRRQISVSLPAETVDRLRQSAKFQKTSVRKVVEKLINDGTLLIK